MLYFSSLQSRKFLEKCALSIFFCLLYNKKFCCIESFCQKKIKVNFEQINKQPSLKWCVPCAIQNANKLRHSNSVTFDAKKAKETQRGWVETQLLKQKHFLNSKNLSSKNSVFENSPKCPSLCPSLLHLVVSSLHRQGDFLWHFSTKKSTYWGYHACQLNWNEEGQMNARSWSIWRRFIG